MKWYAMKPKFGILPYSGLPYHLLAFDYLTIANEFEICSDLLSDT